MASTAPLPTLDPVLYFSPEMLVEIALGAEHPHDIAEKYDFTAEEYEQLAGLPWYAEMVARKRQELNDSGYLFQTKAAMMAEALLTHLFRQAMGAKLAAPMMVEVSKQLVDIGRLKPQPGIPVGNAGPGFQINIQVNGATTALSSPAPTHPSGAGQVGATEPVSAPALTVDFSPVDKSPPGPHPTSPPALPQPPAYISNLATPNFDRDAVVRRGLGAPVSSLAGTPQAQAAAQNPIGLPKSP